MTSDTALPIARRLFVLLQERLEEPEVHNLVPAVSCTFEDLNAYSQDTLIRAVQLVAAALKEDIGGQPLAPMSL